jgi:hypothetical protein
MKVRSIHQKGQRVDNEGSRTESPSNAHSQSSGRALGCSRDCLVLLRTELFHYDEPRTTRGSSAVCSISCVSTVNFYAVEYHLMNLIFPLTHLP